MGLRDLKRIQEGVCVSVTSLCELVLFLEEVDQIFGDLGNFYIGPNHHFNVADCLVIK